MKRIKIFKVHTSYNEYGECSDYSCTTHEAVMDSTPWEEVDDTTYYNIARYLPAIDAGKGCRFIMVEAPAEEEVKCILADIKARVDKEKKKYEDREKARKEKAKKAKKTREE